MSSFFSHKIVRKWFTLIEMLIVIVIIGILAAALIPRFIGAQAKTRNTARKADLSQINIAITAYQWDNGAYPATLQDLVTNNYVKSLPRDPNGKVACPDKPDTNNNGYSYIQYANADGNSGIVLVSSYEADGTNAGANYKGATCDGPRDPIDCRTADCKVAAKYIVTQ